MRPAMQLALVALLAACGGDKDGGGGKKKNPTTTTTTTTDTGAPTTGSDMLSVEVAQMAAGDTIFRDTKKAVANMPKMLESFNTAIKEDRTHPLELSAIFHQMFIYSHPFPDGNGRLGRLLSNFILGRFGHPHIIILKEERQNYIDDLKASDKHNNMLPIINFFYDTSINRMQREIGQKKNLSKNFNLGIEKGGKRNGGISY